MPSPQGGACHRDVERLMKHPNVKLYHIRGELSRKFCKINLYAEFIQH